MKDLFGLTGRQALVTGGAQGLGRMIAEGLLRAGAAVAVTSRKLDAAQRAAAEMADLGPCTAYAADLSTPRGVIDLARRFTDDVEACHILVNNAGRTWGAPLEDFPDDAWPGVMAVNVQTPFGLVRELLPLLRRSARAEAPARVINIGSIAGLKPAGLHAYSYAASKAAILMLTRDLAADLAKDDITVNAVVPGFFPSRMTAHLRDDAHGIPPEVIEQIPLRRFGRPEDIAGTVIFMCSRAGAYLTGTQIVLDGGVLGCR